MWHPLQLIPEGKVRWLSLALFALLFVLAVIWWKESTGSLKTSAAPQGIVSLELANSVTQTKQILSAWEEEGLSDNARRNVYIDFLFLAAYSNGLSITCIMSANVFRGASQGESSLRKGLATFGVALAWQQWLAGLLDVTENVALLSMLGGHVDGFWSAVAWYCALTKFGFVFAGVTYTTLAVLARIVSVVL